MEALAIGLLFIGGVFVAIGAFFFGGCCLLALLHGLRASVSPKSARFARWVGIVNLLFGSLIGAWALSRSGSMGIGGIDLNVVAALGAGVTFVLGAYAFARSWLHPEPRDEAADAAQARVVTLRAGIGAVVLSIAATLAVVALGMLTAS